jgi:lipid A 3-O-deacylase
LIFDNNLQFVVQRLKAERKFSLTFENDIFDMTDRYFTNGARFEWSGPGLAHSPISRLLFSYGHQATIIFSAYLVQNMYTPISTKIPPTLSGKDRPYAAYMILGHRKEITDAARGLKIFNDITFGVIGPYSLGSLMQQGVHHSLPTNDPPLGWETQINNDVVAGYRLQVEKTLAGNKRIQMDIVTAAEAGTLYDNLMAGFRINAGRNLFCDTEPGNLTPKQDKQMVKLNAYLQCESRFIGYDATLQGGVFNHNNIYNLHPNQIKHLVLKAETGISVRYLQYGIELGQTVISPEYSDGKNHMWGRVTLDFYFR